MNAPIKDYERYFELKDREACDEALSAAEREFCRLFEDRYPEAVPELAIYTELANLNAPPDASSRALVERALAQLEAEDGVRESAEARLLRRTHATAWPTLIGVAAFALGATYALIERSPQGSAGNSAPNALVRTELVYASGKVNVSGANAAAGRTLLAQGSVIETTDGGACILIDSDINVCLGPDSRMRLAEVAGPARSIELEAGKLAARLPAQPEGMSLSIVADGVVSTALGTAFSVERADDQSVVTTVLNGKVRVGRGEDMTVVNAHERASSPIGQRAGRVSVASVRRTEEAPSWVLLGPTVLWHDPVAATLEVRGDPEGADAWLDDQWLGATPVSSLIPVGEHRLIIRKDHRELLVRDLHVHAGDAEDVRYDATQQAQAAQLRSPSEAEDDDKNNAQSARRNVARPREVTTKEAPRTPSSDATVNTEPADAADLLRQARQATRLGQFHTAAELYEKLIQSNSDSNEAHTALVSLGQLRLNQLADPSGALAPLDAYLQKGGSIEVEARVARIEALHELKRTGDEVLAIEDFLQHHPRSFETRRMRARLDALHAER